MSAERQTPELWTRVEVAAFLRYKPRTMERISAMPGFPLPARPGNPKVYWADDIIEWVRTQSRPRSSGNRSSTG